MRKAEACFGHHVQTNEQLLYFGQMHRRMIENGTYIMNLKSFLTNGFCSPRISCFSPSMMPSLPFYASVSLTKSRPVRFAGPRERTARPGAAGDECCWVPA